jgi:hypothetical protein
VSELKDVSRRIPLAGGPVFFADTLRWEHLAKYPAVEVVCPPISKSALKDARRDPASADLFREELQKASRRWHKDRVRQKQEDVRRDEERRARRQRCFEDCKEKHFTANTVIVGLGGALLGGVAGPIGAFVGATVGNLVVDRVSDLKCQNDCELRVA